MDETAAISETATFQGTTNCFRPIHKRPAHLNTGVMRGWFICQWHIALATEWLVKELH